MRVTELHLFPFRCRHDVIVIATHDVCVYSHRAQKLCVQVGIVGDVADMQHAKRAAMPILKRAQPFETLRSGHGDDRVKRLGTQLALLGRPIGDNVVVP